MVDLKSECAMMVDGYKHLADTHQMQSKMERDCFQAKFNKVGADYVEMAASARLKPNFKEALQETYEKMLAGLEKQVAERDMQVADLKKQVAATKIQVNDRDK